MLLILSFVQCLKLIGIIRVPNRSDANTSCTPQIFLLYLFTTLQAELVITSPVSNSYYTVSSIKAYCFIAYYIFISLLKKGYLTQIYILVQPVLSALKQTISSRTSSPNLLPTILKSFNHFTIPMTPWNISFTNMLCTVQTSKQQIKAPQLHFPLLISQSITSASSCVIPSVGNERLLPSSRCDVELIGRAPCRLCLTALWYYSF